MAAQILLQFQLEIAIREINVFLCRTLFIRHYLGDLEEFCLYKGGNIGSMAGKINWVDKCGKLLSAMGK